MIKYYMFYYLNIIIVDPIPILSLYNFDYDHTKKNIFFNIEE